MKTDYLYKGKTVSIEIAPFLLDKWRFFVTIGDPLNEIPSRMWGEIERSRSKTEEEVLTHVRRWPRRN